MIKAVLLDVGGTLIAPSPSVGRIYAEIALKHNVKTNPSDLEKRFRNAWKKQKSRQKIMDKPWWREVVFDVIDENSFSNPDNFFDDLYQSFTETNRWKIFPDVIPLLQELKGRHISTAVASNWDSRLPKLLRDLSLANHFEHLFISCLVGHVKPQPAFFQHALKMMGLDPAEVIHVGDDPVEDVTGALGVGIKSILLDRTSSKTTGDQINSLLDLVRFI